MINQCIKKVYRHLLSVCKGKEKIIYNLKYLGGGDPPIMITLFVTASLIFMLDFSKLIINWVGHVHLSED